MSASPAALRVGRLLVRSGDEVVNVQQPRVLERFEALSSPRSLVGVSPGAMGVGRPLLCSGDEVVNVQQPRVLERSEALSV